MLLCEYLHEIGYSMCLRKDVICVNMSDTYFRNGILCVDICN